MRTSKGLLSAGVAGIAFSLLATGVAFAQTTGTQPSTSQGWAGRGGMHRRMPGVFGTVSAISGTSITVSSKGWGQTAAPTTYTVDASGATVRKNGASSNVGDIAVGDTIMVQGTVSGTSVSATAIRDGVQHGPHGMWGKGGANSALSQIQGTGQPVVGGNVSMISGSSLTVLTKAGPSYTVDASGARVVKGGATSTLADVSLGDNVIVQGTVSGTSVAATSVIDQGAPQTASPSTTTTGPKPGFMHGGGFFGAIGGFIQKLFGFF